MINGKATLADLAVCGGAPAFSEGLHVNRPNLGERDVFLNHVNTALDRRWFTNNGPLVQELEERLAHFLSVKHCIVTCNGTAALALAVLALELHGEVIIPSFSFISTAHTLFWHGIDPVFCDIDPVTWNIDPDHCETLITDRTTAIIGTHLWGQACCIRRLEEIAARHSLHLLFDAAHAFGCTHQGRMIGCFGDAEVFSFHATKVFHTFEGGAVTTNDTDLAARLRTTRNFGFAGYDRVETLGTNAKMPEVCAAVGLANLQSIEHFFEENQRTHERYRRGLKDVPGLRLLCYDPDERNNYQYVVLQVKEDETGLTRDQLLRILHAENVLARRYFYPGNHRMEPYRSRFPQADQELPDTNLIARRVLLLPGGTGVTEAQVREICAILRLVVDNASSLDAILESKDSVWAGSQAATEATARRAPKVVPGTAAPTVEIRIPISANEKFLRMVHYFLESLQEYGGPIGRSAHCVLSVSRDEPYRDLSRECSWAAKHSVEFQWVDRSLFEARSYGGTGLHRLTVPSEADIVILADADLLVVGDFDFVIWEAYRSQRLLGRIAGHSPFRARELQHIPSHRWWNWIFEEAGLQRPRLHRVHESKSAMHWRCPDYFNYGFIVSPRVYVERMGETFEAELDAVDRVVETWYKSQIANTLAFARHEIPCGTLPINCNYWLPKTDNPVRSYGSFRRFLLAARCVFSRKTSEKTHKSSQVAAPSQDCYSDAEDARILHYLGDREINREHFATRASLEGLLRRDDLSSAGSVFQRKLRIIHERIMADSAQALPQSR